ncbi:MAG: BatD family protein [Pseudomonadota bacterium]
MTRQQTGRWLPRSRKAALTALTLFLFGLTSAAQAQLTATVDRTQATELDLVTLLVRLTNATATTTPDFSGVEQDFVLVSQSGPNRSSRFIFSNGQQVSESHTEWSLTLRPRRTGRLIIPSIRLGNESTSPITIDVAAASAAVTQQMNQFVFFDTSVDTKRTYVQAQVIYTVKLFYVDAISGDFPPPPALDNAVIETIENEKRYEAVVNNRRFYVLEKRYAIYPQQSGQFVIPRETFSGTRGRGSFFSARERVSAVSDRHVIDVSPRPEAFTGDHWLPARQVTLEESWTDAEPRFRVGEPINRTLTLTADGLASSLLPRFDELNLANAKTYQDPPETLDMPTDSGLVSTLKTTIGIVPTEPGFLVLPEVRVPWWNTTTDRMEVAVLPERTFKVEPGANASITAPPPLPRPEEFTSNERPGVSAMSGFWRNVAIGLLIAWMLTAWQWWRLRARLGERVSSQAPAVPTRPETEQATFDALKQACQRHDAAAAHAALQQWARTRYSGLRSLSELGRLADCSTLAQEEASLERVLYAPGGQGNWSGDGLVSAVMAVRQRKTGKTGRSDLTPSLNPG